MGEEAVWFANEGAERKTGKGKHRSVRRAARAGASASTEHAVPKEMLYKKSLRESCANGSCPGALRGLWVEGLDAAEGYFQGQGETEGERGVKSETAGTERRTEERLDRTRDRRET